MEATKKKPMDAFAIGWWVGGGLAVLTIIEYIVAVNMHNNFIPLTAMALVKAVAIIWYFMHIFRIWRPEEH